ncbi:LuxR C-terminal-related transcriptional regulator [Streptomyces bluensis]|uniref:LuxR C-terminal-related transcriptional regulator n=1 Tax=Streptomyces bluensis TaxID=33897 RepID=UPI003316934C
MIQVDETDLTILNLLYGGFDDASIARRLGLGHRTVQRRVQRLMDSLEAKGRVALGARAQELGLLPPP